MRRSMRTKEATSLASNQNQWKARMVRKHENRLRLKKAGGCVRWIMSSILRGT